MTVANRNIEQIVVTKDGEVIAVISDCEIIEQDGASVALMDLA